MKLATTDTQHHHLEGTIGSARDTSTHVKVDKLALKNLLADHADMVQRLTKIGPVETQS